MYIYLFEKVSFLGLSRNLDKKNTLEIYNISTFNQYYSLPSINEYFNVTLTLFQVLGK